MTFASPVRRAPLAALVFVVATAARTAAADPPPSDLPALSGPPVQTSGAPAPAPVPPGAPVTPPGRPATPPGQPALPPGYVAPSGAAPPGLSWMSPSSGAPTYGYYPAPYPGAQASATLGGDPYALPPLPPRRRYDTKLFVGGVAAVVGGMGAALIGAYLVSSAADRIDIYCDQMLPLPCAHKTDIPRMAGGGLMMAVGALAGAAGIPMWVIGARYVTVPKDENEKKPALLPDVRIGAGSASVTLHF